MIFILALACIHAASAAVIDARFWRMVRLDDFLCASFLTAYLTFYGFPIIIGWTTGHINSWTIFFIRYRLVGLEEIPYPPGPLLEVDSETCVVN